MNKIWWVVLAMVFAIMLSGCQAGEDLYYSDLLEMRIYGNESIDEKEVEQIRQLVTEYAGCLFCVTQPEPKVDAELLQKLAPKDNAEEWDSVYKENNTESKLLGVQVLDIYVKEQDSISCLSVCEADYCDWETPRGEYLFVVQIELERNKGWYITSSKLLGTTLKAKTELVRDDITNEIKFIGKEVETSD